MADDPNPSAFKRLLEVGAGPAIGLLFFTIVFMIATIATARSKSPWDTAIAALAMGSQAFFAFVVWRLGKAQFAFTRRVMDRQHQIDAYSLRGAVIERLNTTASDHLYDTKAIYDGVDEKFRKLHVEITRLFSKEASDLAFELSEAINEAVIYTLPRVVDPAEETINWEQKECDIKNLVDQAFECYLELEEMLEEEARIR